MGCARHACAADAVGKSFEGNSNLLESRLRSLLRLRDRDLGGRARGWRQRLIICEISQCACISGGRARSRGGNVGESVKIKRLRMVGTYRRREDDVLSLYIFPLGLRLRLRLLRMIQGRFQEGRGAGCMRSQKCACVGTLAGTPPTPCVFWSLVGEIFRGGVPLTSSGSSACLISPPPQPSDPRLPGPFIDSNHIDSNKTTNGDGDGDGQKVAFDSGNSADSGSVH
jgi:hypothetical protein